MKSLVLQLTIGLALSSPALAEPIENVVGSPAEIPASIDLSVQNPMTTMQMRPQAPQVWSHDSGFCRLMMPQRQDQIGRFCNNAYGFSYDGYIVNNACFYQAEAALQKMRETDVCYQQPPPRHGYCQLINPNVRDRSNRFCDKTYGFTYMGYVVDNTCYHDVDMALHKMRSTSACRERPDHNRCRISQPGERDRNQRFCTNSYGVNYQGYILDNTCYHSLDQALERMRSSSLCHH